MKQRFSQVKSLKTLISDLHNKYMIILMNWKAIVGKSNAGIMMPVELKQKTLEIAIPNNMVLSIASKFASEIIKKANLCLENEGVGKLKFEIKPEFFKKAKTERTKAVKNVTGISKEEIAQKKQELIDKFGLEENFAGIAAEIELLNIKRGQNEQ